MIKQLFFKAILFLFSITLLSSCGAIVKSKAQKHVTVEEGAIPPQLGSDGTTMLFITYKQSYNKYLVKNVKKRYQGRYEFVSREEFESNNKYGNADRYRYIFDYSERPAGNRIKRNTITTGDFDITTIRTRPALFKVKKFAIVDRKENKVYACNMTSSYWSKLQKMYLNEIELVRARNSAEKMAK